MKKYSETNSSGHGLKRVKTMSEILKELICHRCEYKITLDIPMIRHLKYNLWHCQDCRFELESKIKNSSSFMKWIRNKGKK